MTLLLFLVVGLVSINLSGRASANFFPDISSIPPSLIPNTTIWDSFNNLTGSHKGVKSPGLSKLKKYFQLFGYLNTSYDNFSDDFDDTLESAVKNYQLNFNLNATGQLDAPTLRHIVLPRCGNPDIINGTSTMRSGNSSNTSAAKNSTIHNTVKHYSFFPDRPRWPPGTSQLTYAFLPENQLSDAVKGVFSRAFERWSEVTALTFVEAASFDEADLKIGFYSGDHGDGEPFDGVMGTLAHAFSPPAGMFHLDGDENWVINGDFIDASAVDLESVAVHEIGHLLGLGHSSVEEAIMYPTILWSTRKVELADDDIMGIQELYGSNRVDSGSGQTLTPIGERDMGGAPRLDNLLGSGIVLVLGLLFY